MRTGDAVQEPVHQEAGGPIQQRSVRVGSRLGLQARVAVLIVGRAVRFRARVTLQRPGSGPRADGLSILDLLRLGPFTARSSS